MHLIEKHNISLYINSLAYYISVNCIEYSKLFNMRYIVIIFILVLVVGCASSGRSVATGLEIEGDVTVGTFSSIEMSEYYNLSNTRDTTVVVSNGGGR